MSPSNLLLIYMYGGWIMGQKRSRKGFLRKVPRYPVVKKESKYFWIYRTKCNCLRKKSQLNKSHISLRTSLLTDQGRIIGKIPQEMLHKARVIEVYNECLFKT